MEWEQGRLVKEILGSPLASFRGKAHSCAAGTPVLMNLISCLSTSGQQPMSAARAWGNLTAGKEDGRGVRTNKKGCWFWVRERYKMIRV